MEYFILFIERSILDDDASNKNTYNYHGGFNKGNVA